MRAILALAGSLTFVAGLAGAGPASNGSVTAGRGVERSLCACIQTAADMTLDSSDQKLAARLITGPGKAEEIRISERSRDKALWSRHQDFASAAGALCAAS